MKKEDLKKEIIKRKKKVINVIDKDLNKLDTWTSSSGECEPITISHNTYISFLEDLEKRIINVWR